MVKGAFIGVSVILVLIVSVVSLAAHLLCVASANFPQWKIYGSDFVYAFSNFCCSEGELDRFNSSCCGRLAVFASEVTKLHVEQFKPIEQVTLEPFEWDHACVVGGYRVPKKQKAAVAAAS